MESQFTSSPSISLIMHPATKKHCPASISFCPSTKLWVCQYDVVDEGFGNIEAIPMEHDDVGHKSAQEYLLLSAYTWILLHQLKEEMSECAASGVIGREIPDDVVDALESDKPYFELFEWVMRVYTEGEEDVYTLMEKSLRDDIIMNDGFDIEECGGARLMAGKKFRWHGQAYLKSAYKLIPSDFVVKEFYRMRTLS